MEKYIPWEVTDKVLHNGGKIPGGSDGKDSAFSAGDLGSIPALGGSPGEGNGNLLQYSCWKTPQRSLADYIVNGVAKSQTQLSNQASHTVEAMEPEVSLELYSFI